MLKIFIDGREGTTGLRIYERLSARSDVELLLLPEELRKDTAARKEMLNRSDVAFLCLPDVAAREAVSLVENSAVKLIDASTAHRTVSDWAYGFPELSPVFYENVQKSSRVAVPGCHASGFIALVYPLLQAGLLRKDIRLSCHSITGYSGGGKKMIAEYRAQGRSPLLDAPRQYGLTQQHKHLKEMQWVTGLHTPPIFCPMVADFYSGMEVTVPLFKEDLQKGAGVAAVKEVYAHCYPGPLVTYAEEADEGGLLSAVAFSEKDSMQLAVFGNEDRLLLVARYDNLGKGASGAAIECLNIMMGKRPTWGLDV